MSVFESDFAEDLKNPKFAYEFGRHERELEIIKLLEAADSACSDWAIALIKGESDDML